MDLINQVKFNYADKNRKVIVSTYSDEYKNKRHLLEMVDDISEYEGKFKEVINNLDKYNNSEKQTIRKEYAEKNTYGKQVQKIEQLLLELGFDD